MPDKKQQEIEFVTQVECMIAKTKSHFFKVPEELALSLGNKFPFRAVATMGKHSFHCGIVKRGLNGFVVEVGLHRLKKAGINVEEDVLIKLVADNSKYGYELPIEMEELLLQDEEGKGFWEELNPGHQRGLLHYICEAKSMDVRIKRALVAIQRAREIVTEKRKKLKDASRH